MTTENPNYGKKLSSGEIARAEQVLDLLFSAVSKDPNKNYLVRTPDLLSLITKSTVGLDLVDNTSDEQKPLSLAVREALALKANGNHTHLAQDIEGLTELVNQLLDSYTTPISAIVGLSEALAEKADVGHTHGVSDILGLSDILADKAQRLHLHSLGDINGATEVIQAIWAALDDKAPTLHTHTTNQIENFDTEVLRVVNGAGGTVGQVGVGSMDW